MSGADLEYSRMLREAGINPATAQGYDAARLEQIADSADQPIPAALLPAYLQQAALNAAYMETGEAIPAALLPAYLQQAALNAAYMETGEAITNAQLPARLGTEFNLAHSYIADPDNITVSGFYYTEDADIPTAGYNYILAFVYDTDYQTQISFSAATGIHLYTQAQRQKDGGVWTAWRVTAGDSEPVSTATQTALNLKADISTHIMSRYSTVNQAIANNTRTTITFPTEKTSVGDITYSAGEFTIPNAGSYMISTSVMWVANATGQRFAELQVNGTALAVGESTPNAAAYPSCIISRPLVLAANDVVKIVGYQSSGGNLDVFGGLTSTFCDIFRLT